MYIIECIFSILSSVIFFLFLLILSHSIVAMLPLSLSSILLYSFPHLHPVWVHKGITSLIIIPPHYACNCFYLHCSHCIYVEYVYIRAILYQYIEYICICLYQIQNVLLVLKIMNILFKMGYSLKWKYRQHLILNF